MSDLFIGSTYRPNRPEAVNFKPVSRPGASPDRPQVTDGNDQFIKSREKTREKVFGEKHSHEKRSIEKEKEKGCFEKTGEKQTKEKNTFEKDAEKAIWPPESKGCKVEKNAEKMSVEKRIEKFDEKTQVEKHSEKRELEKMNVEKSRCEKPLGEKHLEIDPGWLNAGGGAVPSERFFYK